MEDGVGAEEKRADLLRRLVISNSANSAGPLRAACLPLHHSPLRTTPLCATPNSNAPLIAIEGDIHPGSCISSFSHHH